LTTERNDIKYTTTPLHAPPGQALKIKDGDYYVGDTMILNHARAAALLCREEFWRGPWRDDETRRYKRLAHNQCMITKMLTGHPMDCCSDGSDNNIRDRRMMSGLNW